jgi:quercetin dioxygenase-like cupin family protein
VHHSFEEAFYVLEGEIEYRVGKQRIRATAGSMVFVPMGAPHEFRNVHSGPSRHLAVASDPRVAQMIDELGRSSPEHYAEIFARYDSVPVLD